LFFGLANHIYPLANDELLTDEQIFGKTMFMKSEREKREEEIERLMREAGLKREADIAFQEAIKKAAAAIVEEDAKKLAKTERVPRDWSISPTTAALWLLVLGAGVAFSMPSLGAALILCGIAVFVWATFLRSSKKKARRRDIQT
jgi:hypothetical protein